jgi:hypothetical protein
MQNGQYLKASIEANDSFDFYGHVKYYFATTASVDVRFSNEELRSVGYSQFLTDKVQITGRIINNGDNWEVFGIDISGYY